AVGLGLDGAQYIVTDSFFQYDAVVHSRSVSQPRYVVEAASPFASYLARDTVAVEKWTATYFDPLDRPVTVTTPDGLNTTTAYTRTAIGWLASTTDANSHTTSHET